MAMRLALVVIARDEAPRIRRLLDSVRPWVDEMLVLDTGSTDGTPAQAAASGARVRPFAWCDDFSAARNAALDAADADWHLVLDADEWLIEGGAALHALRGAEPGFVGTVALENHFDAAEGSPAGVSRLRLSRLLPRGVRYGGRVHEQPVHQLPVQALPLVVGHDGYCAERLAFKRGRNRSLLLADLEHAPEDAYLLYQLGKDHGVYGDHAQAAQAFAQAESVMAATSPWRLDLVVRQLYSLKKLGLHAEGMAWADRHLAACGDAPDYCFALGDLLLDWAAQRPALADRLLPLAADAWQRCLDIGEQPGLSGSVAGRGSYLAAHNLALIYEGVGQAVQAHALRERYPMPSPGR